MASFCVDDKGTCFPKVNGSQFATPVSVQTGPDVKPIADLVNCFGQTEPDVPASKGGSQEEKTVQEYKRIKRKRTLVTAVPVFSKVAKDRPRPIFIRKNTGESHQMELNSGMNNGTVKEGADQVTEEQVKEGADQVIEEQFEFSEENEVDREYSALREEADRVNEKKDKLLQDYDDQFKGIIQLVQDQRENLLSRFTDVRHHSVNLRPETKNVETRLKDLRLAARGKYSTIIKAEKEKRWKTESELQSEKGRNSKLDADLHSEKAKCAKLETQVQSEKGRNSKLDADLHSMKAAWANLETQVKFDRSMWNMLLVDLQEERAGREKLNSCLKSEEVKRLKLEEDVRSERARRMILEAEVESHEAQRVKVQEDVQLEREKRLKLEESIQSEKEKRLKLEEDFRLSEQKMESERLKLLCQICLEAIRDTMILPCTHFLYCNGCLVEHKTRGNNTCPSCRGSMTALLHCHLDVF